MLLISVTTTRPIQFVEISLEEAISRYGKPVEIEFNEAWAECSTAELFKKPSCVASLIIDDEMFDNFKAYEDPEFRQEFNIPEWAGEKPPSPDYEFMLPGCFHGAANYYRFSEPIPADIKIVGINYNLFN